MNLDKIEEMINTYHKQTTDGVGLLKADIDALKLEIANFSDQGDPRRPVGMDTHRDVTEYTFATNALNETKLPLLGRDQSVARATLGGRREIDPMENCLSNMVRARLGQRLPENTSVGSSSVVPDALSAIIVDDVRAKSTVMRAGTVTIPLTTGGTTTFGRITGDPTVYSHTEGAEDVTESDILFDGVTAKPVTIAALVPVSMELLQDSANIERMLRTSFTAAFSGKIDSLFLAALLADGDIPTSSAGQSTATWAGVLAAVTEALAADQDLPSAYVGSEADFMARSSLTTTDGLWIGKPPVLAGMNELYSTRVSAGTAIFGNFAQGAALASWVNNLTIEVIKFTNPNALTHLVCAYMRVKPLILQPKILFNQQGTVE